MLFVILFVFIFHDYYLAHFILEAGAGSHISVRCGEGQNGCVLQRTSGGRQTAKRQDFVNILMHYQGIF